MYCIKCPTSATRFCITLLDCQSTVFAYNSVINLFPTVCESLSQYTVNSLFLIVEIFSDAHKNLLLGYYSTTKLFLQRNIISVVYLELKCAHVSDYSQNVSSPLSQAVATRPQRIALRSATFCRYCLGSLEHIKSSPTTAAHISL